ncbi:hypothetical protein [Mesorhizobium sp. B2-2-1]|uniref:hypothetical protein n=1 Tax=Mesorhizobium sp. B2-2-1 TaxID=2589965 RepID=UPI00112664B9|nr:hypothetical protein [Mesorhizobium sp. B2-2-1]TPM67433.1 hypothetical protein FJ965_09860 [Mesorhizobium sp. B2-2-1]
MSERIISVAMRVGGLVISMPQPARHHTVLHEMDAQGISPFVHPINQGFITDTGRFVEREEAVGLAKASGQIDKPRWPPLLYSEDLW